MNNPIWKVEERSSGIPYYVIIKNGITYKERGNEKNGRSMVGLKEKLISLITKNIHTKH